MANQEKGVYRFGIQRKIVAQMTSQSWKSVPHVSFLFEPDVTDFLTAYRKFDDGLKAKGEHVTMNTVIIKILCEGLKAAPDLNAHIHFEPKLVRGKVTTFNNIDISMPWILPDGKMMTITMKDMGNRSLKNITEYMADTARKIKNTNLNEVMNDVAMNDTFEALAHGKVVQVLQRLYGSKTNPRHRVRPLTGEAKKAYEAISDNDKLTKADLKQGTITISNVGAITREHRGTLAMLMIIPPQVCAIGIGALQKKPVVKTNAKGEDEIVVSSTIPLCICFDHRVLDFGDIKPFLDEVQRIFDDPSEVLKYE